MDEQEIEIFDVISSTLTEKGFIQTWKSELMCQAVKPLYQSSVLKRISVTNGENGDRARSLLKLRILTDLLDKLGLQNTKQMLLTEVDTEDVDLEADILPETKILPVPEIDEPYLNALWRTCGEGYLDKYAPGPEEDTDHDLPSLNDSGEQGDSMKEQDIDGDELFQTAISKLEGELEDTTIRECRQGDGVAD